MTLFTFYMLTFFRMEQVNHQDALEIYVASTVFVTSRRMTTCSPKHIAHPEAPQPILQLHSTRPRKAPCIPSLVNGTVLGWTLHTARPHVGGPAESHFQSVQKFASLCQAHLDDCTQDVSRDIDSANPMPSDVHSNSLTSPHRFYGYWQKHEGTMGKSSSLYHFS